jgi:hypothetical protein
MGFLLIGFLEALAIIGVVAAPIVIVLLLSLVILWLVEK